MDPHRQGTSGNLIAGSDPRTTRTATTQPINALAPDSIILGLTRADAPTWRVPDALRELYHNWKDAILETHQIGLSDFAPNVMTSPDEIMITVEEALASTANEDAEPPKLLGYICFNRQRGSVEFTNFGSSFDYSCLEMGYTSKKVDDRLVGGHGKGLKIAALVLCREGHRVKIAANGCSWHFGFNDTSEANFVCHLTSFGTQQGPGAVSSQRAPPRLSSKIQEDVSITIKGLPLQEGDFEAWRHHTIDLDPAAPWIRTLSGDLLLAPSYRGRLYLKGIRVPETGWGHSAFHFGYNLFSGRIGWDRQMILNASQVTDSINAVWEEAIAKHEAEILPLYLELLRIHPSSDDVTNADRVVTEVMARKLWAILRAEAAAADKIYYPESHRDQDDPIIRSELKKNASPLPDLLWNMLRKYNLVQEPLEELHSRFRHSQEVILPDTVFGQGVARTLRALMLLHPSTVGIRVVFVRCDTHTVDLSYQADGGVLYVHEKWLHSTVPPTPSTPSANPECAATIDVFACQQVVEELYCRSLTMVLGQPDGMRSGSSIWQLLQVAQQKLRQMACIVQVSPMKLARTLKVAFYTGHSLAYVDLHGAQSHYLVILHTARCFSAKENLVYSANNDVCDCPRQSVSLLARTAVFGNLGHGPWIPTVVKMRDSTGPVEELPGDSSLKAQDGALIGVLPLAITPLGWDDASVAGEDDPANSAYGITVKDTVGKGNSVVALEAKSPLGRIKNDRDAREGDDTLFEADTISNPDADSFSEEITQDIAVIDSNSWKKRAETEKCADSRISVNTLSSDAFETAAGPRQLDADALPINNVLVTCYPHSKDQDQKTPLYAAHQAESDVSSQSSPPGLSLGLSKKGTAWWTAWPAQYHGAYPENITTEHCRKQLDGSYGWRDEYQQFSKGKHVQVTIGPGSSSGRVSRCILYIHGVLVPVQDRASPKVIATRYTFLVDHPILRHRAVDCSDKELLVHFKDLDQLAEEGDAEVLDTHGMILSRAGELVPHSAVTSTPDPSTGFFARFGVREGLSETTLFAAPVELSPLSPRGPSRPSSFTSLPVAAVLDLSPDDTNLSAGFAHAGYQIHAAIGFNAVRHQAWKLQHTDAVVYSDDAASILTNLEEEEAVLSGLGETRTPRIVTISGCGSPMVPISSKGYLDPCQLCNLVARSSIINADFIVLVLPRSAPETPGSLEGSLTHTACLVLKAGYSITLRVISQDYVLLLAAPGETKPQWIDDTLSELQGLTAPLEVETDESNESGDSQRELGDPSRGPRLTITPPPEKSFAKPDFKNGNGPNTLEDEQGRGPVPFRVARNIATTVSRVIGEFSKRNDSGAPVTGASGERFKRLKV